VLEVRDMDEQSIRGVLRGVEADLADERWDRADEKLARLAAEAQAAGDPTLAAWVSDAGADLIELSTAEEPPERVTSGRDPRSAWAWLPILAIFLILVSGGGWATVLIILAAVIGSGLALWFNRDWLPLSFRTPMVRRVGAVRRAGVLRGFTGLARVPYMPAVAEPSRVRVAGGATEPLRQGEDPRWTYTVVSAIDTPGFSPSSLAVSPDGSRLYVIDSDSPESYGPSTLSVVDLVTNQHAARVQVGEDVVEMAVSPEGDRLYVVDSARGTVSVIDTGSFTVLATMEVGADPQAVAVSPMGTRIYVANASSNTISVIERAPLSPTVDDGDVLHSARLDPDSYALVRQYLDQREQLPIDSRAARARELSQQVAARLEVTPPENSAAVDAFLEWVAAAYQGRQQPAPVTSAAPEAREVPSPVQSEADATPRPDGATTESEQPPAPSTEIRASPAAPDPSMLPPTAARQASATDAPLTGVEPSGTQAEAVSELPADQPTELARSDQPALPAVGQTTSNADWEVTLTGYGPYDESADQPAAGRPQSRQVLVDFAARNRQDRTATFTLSDFALESAGGRRYSPAAQTSYIANGVPLIQTVPPSSTTQNRLVFDLDVDATDLTLVILGLRFRPPA
jgi:YVTN family beta-propeller protein